MNDGMSIGGVERVLLTILTHLDRKKYDISLLIPSKNDIWVSLIPADIKVISLLNENPITTGKYKKLYYGFLMFLNGPINKRLVVKEDYDVIIAFKESMIAYFNGKQTKKICWIHDDYSIEKITDDIKGLKRLVMQYSEKKRVHFYKTQCDLIVNVSEHCKEAFKKKFLTVRDNVICCYNPNDVDRIRDLAEEVITDFPKGPFVMCTVGRIAEQKAHLRLVNIAGRLKSEGYKFKIVIIGEGPLEKSIKEKVQLDQLEDYVILLGARTNPYPYIKRANLFVMSSIWEGYCTSTTEAAILGIPAVTTDVGGARELYHNTNAGLVTENNEEALYQGIKGVLENNEKLEVMSSAAKILEKTFSTVKYMGNLESII
jgi:glycosyltransferase involved in cell wall biosynthesis